MTIAHRERADRTPRLDRRVRAAAVACTVVLGVASGPSARGDISGFTQGGAGPNDYTLNGNAAATGAGVPAINVGTLQLTTATNSQASSAFYNTPQTFTNFTATYLYDMGGGSANPADGFAFVIQNDPRGPAALGGGGGALGYQSIGAVGIAPSVAIGYDIYNGAATNPTRTGSAQDGGPFYYVNTGVLGTTPSGVNLRANPIRIDLAYNDGVFTQTLTDTVSGATSSQRFNRNLPLVLSGTNTAYVGFSGATGGLNAEQFLSNFTFTTGNAPGVTPRAQLLTGVPQGGAGFFGVREVSGATTCCGDLAQTQSAVTGASGGTTTEYTADRLNLLDTGNAGRFTDPQTPDAPYRSNNADVGGADQINNVALVATGTIRVPTTGIYTFGVASDDGFRLIVGGHRFETTAGQAGTVIADDGALEFRAGRGSGDTSFGSVTLPAGEHPIQLLNWEGTGGASLELMSAQGLHTGMNRNFNLIGAPAQQVPRRAPRLSAAGFDVVTFSSITDPDAAGPLTALDAAVTAYNEFLSGNRTPFGREQNAPNIFYSDPNGRGANRNNQADFGPDRGFPGDTAANEDNFGTGARGLVTVDTPGIYTFDVLADDSIRFRILNSAGTPVNILGTAGGAGNGPIDTDGNTQNDAFRTTGCCADAFGHYDLAAGEYTVELIHQEGGGGSSLSLFGAFGRYDYFDPEIFQLLGQNIDTVGTRPAGLELVPEPGSLGVLALASLGLLHRRRRRT